MAFFINSFTAHLRLLTPAVALALAPLACSGDDTGTSDTATTGSGSTSGSTSDTSSSSTTDDSTTTAASDSETGTTDTSDATGTTMDGTTANDSGDGDCVEESTVLAADEASPLGFSADDALAGISGPRSGTLTWVDEMIISDAYRGTELPITLGVAYDGGAITFVEATDNGEVPDPNCVSRVEIEVKVDFASDGGEFAETGAGIVRATSADAVELYPHKLFPPALTGTLDLDALMGLDLTLDGMDLLGTFDADKATGGVNGEASDPNLGSIGYGSLATLVAGAPQ
ncbi:MAG: hypothetical protein KC486_30985 [Myxococcales bacterium]|nr:hypothetical protein [Myxococcales bacterium]